MRTELLRPPPAFQEYGADILNRETVKLMSLSERGLLATMRWCIWQNDTLPAGYASLARVLGLHEAEVRANLTPAVLQFFESSKDSERLHCPELTAYKARLMMRRLAQSKAAKSTNKTLAKRRKAGA